MAHLQDREVIIEKIRSILYPRKEIELVYLYGSHAKGTTNPRSDIDIAILINEDISDEAYPYGYRAEVLSDLMRVFQTDRIDLVILNDAPPFLRFQVIRYGVLIFSRSEARRIDFQVRTFATYNDVKRLLDVQHHYLTQRLKDGTYGKK